jgi:hypothetical protein
MKTHSIAQIAYCTSAINGIALASSYTMEENLSLKLITALGAVPY